MPVFSVSSPLVNPIEATVNMSVFFSVRLEQAPARSCSATNPSQTVGKKHRCAWKCRREFDLRLNGSAGH